jgi:hypothetical protein
MSEPNSKLLSVNGKTNDPGQDFEIFIDNLRNLGRRTVADAERDKVFVIEREKMVRALEALRTGRPQVFKAFFSRWTSTQTVTNALRTFLEKLRVANKYKLLPTEEKVLRDYIAFVARFGIGLRPDSAGGFRSFAVRVGRGDKFHAAVRHGHARPLQDDEHWPGDFIFPDCLESPELAVPSSLAQLIKDHLANVVYLDEADGKSLLTEMERYIYDPTRVTFMLHKAAQPFLYCLVGERVSVSTWKRAGKAVTAIHKEIVGRTKAGRPANAQRLTKAWETRKEKGNISENITVQSGPDRHFYSERSYVSRAEQQVRGTVKPRQSKQPSAPPPSRTDSSSE